MSFRDDEQRARACMALCASVKLHSAWTYEGPSRVALEVRDGKDTLSSGERLLVRVAWTLWSGEEDLRLAELVGALDARRMRLVATLLVAVAEGSAAVDKWLVEHGPAPRPPVH